MFALTIPPVGMKPGSRAWLALGVKVTVLYITGCGHGLSHRPAMRAKSCTVRTRLLWGLRGSNIMSSEMVRVRIEDIIDWG